MIESVQVKSSFFNGVNVDGGSTGSSIVYTISINKIEPYPIIFGINALSVYIIATYSLNPLGSFVLLIIEHCFNN
jgi:hypothetical protein